MDTEARLRVELMTDHERDRAMILINELAPCTRRDEWWSTDGPYEIIAKYIRFAVRSEVIVMSKKGKGGKGKGC